MSLLQYVTWWHKTNLNGHCYDYWGSKGWSMIWFLEHMELAAPEWFPSGASWRPSVNCVNEYPYSSMWPDNTKPTWMDVVMNNKSAIGGQLLVSWSRLELGAPEWFPRGALRPEAVCKSHEWMSLLQYVTWCHKTNLNGHHYDYWVS